jgi:hypothetical protein
VEVRRLRQALILIRETFVLGEDEYTKTDSSQRDIQMTQVVFEALKASTRPPASSATTSSATGRQAAGQRQLRQTGSGTRCCGTWA